MLFLGNSICNGLRQFYSYYPVYLNVTDCTCTNILASIGCGTLTQSFINLRSNIVYLLSIFGYFLYLGLQAQINCVDNVFEDYQKQFVNFDFYLLGDLFTVTPQSDVNGSFDKSTFGCGIPI